jgi:hypothetical protein
MTRAFIIHRSQLTGAVMTTPSNEQAQPSTLTATGVFVILTSKPGVTREQIFSIIPNEVRDTVKLYLDGRIREWYSHARGVIFLLDSKDVEDARALMNSLPLSKEGLMDYEYIPVGPLMPLRFLIGQTGEKH